MFCLLGSLVEETPCEHGENMQTPHRKAREIAHLSTEGLGRRICVCVCVCVELMTVWSGVVVVCVSRVTVERVRQIVYMCQTVCVRERERQRALRRQEVKERFHHFLCRMLGS